MVYVLTIISDCSWIFLHSILTVFHKIEPILFVTQFAESLQFALVFKLLFFLNQWSYNIYSVCEGALLYMKFKDWLRF